MAIDQQNRQKILAPIFCSIATHGPIAAADDHRVRLRPQLDHHRPAALGAGRVRCRTLSGGGGTQEAEPVRGQGFGVSRSAAALGVRGSRGAGSPCIHPRVGGAGIRDSFPSQTGDRVRQLARLTHPTPPGFDRGRTSVAQFVTNRCQTPARGDAHGRAKLTEAAVREARRLNRQGHSVAGLARRLGVKSNTLGYAITSKTWIHVE